MEISYQKECSRTFTVARVFALISIVSAHIVFPDTTPFVIDKLYSCLASIGVIAFLFMSAYYYRPEKFDSIWAMLKNKLVSIGIPWLFLGSLSYAYNAILGSSFSVTGYLQWIIGYKTYLYFLTVLFLCFILFYKTNRVVCWAAIVINLASLMLTAAGVLEPVINALHITDYLNIFNWIGVFAVGQLFRSLDPKTVYHLFYRLRWISTAVFVAATVLIIVLDIPTGYFSFVGIWYEIIGCFCIFGLSTVRFFGNRLFENIANHSFAVYLIHMVLIGLFDRIYNLSPITQALSSAIIIAIAVIGLSVCRWIIQKIRLERFLNPLFGFRTRTIAK